MKRERRKPNTSNSNQQTRVDNKRIHKSSKSRFSDNGSFFSKKLIFLSILIISILSFISYYSIFDNEITSWDDEFYINTNPYLKTLDAETISELFKTDTYYMGNYHPLSMISLSIDYAISGEDENGNINSFMFHLTNLILHILTSLLVFWFVLLLLKNFNLALLSALFFGVHAIHVESVAWISERKDVLYAFFFLASLVSYVKYIDSKKLLWYFVALLLFLLSLFSKGQAVSLAVTIIIIDWFKERKLLDFKLIAEKVPFIAFAIFFGLIAIGAQKESEALADEQAYEFIQRIGIASYAFMQYISKLIIPINLSAIYPYPDIIHQTIPGIYYFMILPVIVIIALSIWLFIKKKNILVFAIAFFVANIFLLLQFIPVGSAVYADRYTYIPSVGFFILLSALILKFIKNRPKVRNLIFSLTGIYIVLLMTLSFKRSDIWQNSETLWTDTTEKSPNSVIAWNNLGSFNDKEAKKAMDEIRLIDAKVYRKKAIKYFSKAIKGKPDYRNAFYNRGVSELELGKMNNDTLLFKASIKDFDSALAHDGQFSDAFHNRGNAKSEINNFAGAIKDYNIAIDIKLMQKDIKELSNCYSNRGVTKGKSGDLDGAIKDFKEAIRISPKEASAYSNIGRANMLKGNLKNAISYLSKAIVIDPTSYAAYLNRAVARQKLNDLEGALSDFTKVTELNPNFADAYFSKGNILILMNKITEACSYFEKAKKIGHPYAEALLLKYCK